MKFIATLGINGVRHKQASTLLGYLILLIKLIRMKFYLDQYPLSCMSVCINLIALQMTVSFNNSLYSTYRCHQLSIWQSSTTVASSVKKERAAKAVLLKAKDSRRIKKRMDIPKTKKVNAT